jgi:hypothetical protein
MEHDMMNDIGMHSVLYIDRLGFNIYISIQIQFTIRKLPLEDSARQMVRIKLDTRKA